MENEIMEINDVNEVEEVEETSGGNTLRNVAIGGAVITGGILAAKYIIAPKIKKVKRRRAAWKNFKASYTEDDYDEEFYEDADYEEVEEEEGE
ncbi:MAG: hypothetical protein LIO96_08005 [Lachnospiraceae bacterium]|nr:hypothetical protein [Lachnospiraceae bacterium]